MKEGKFLSKLFSFIFIILIILCILGAVVFYYINSKINLMNIQELDKSDLAVSEDVYKDVSDGIKVFAIFGSDARINDESMGARADTIMLCSVDTVNHKINLISIPRDTYVNIEGYYKTKINHAYAYGKEQLLLKTINQNFSLAVDQYVTLDFSGVINIINAMGGVDLEISEEERCFINSRLDESYALSGRTKEEVTEVGLVHLNGEQVLAHVRDRSVGNDFDRQRRQRDAITAIVNKAGTLKISEATELLNTGLSQVKTNVDAWEYIKLVPNFIMHIDEYKQNINSLQLPNKDCGKDKYIRGTYYFVPDVETTTAAFRKQLYGIEENSVQ